MSVERQTQFSRRIEWTWSLPTIRLVPDRSRLSPLRLIVSDALGCGRKSFHKSTAQLVSWFRGIALALSLLLCGLAGAGDQANPIRLFKADIRTALSPQGSARLKSLEHPRYRITTARSAELSTFQPAGLKPNDRVLIPVGPGESYEVVLSRVYEIYAGYTGLLGAVVGFPDSSFELTVRSDGAAGAEGRLIFGGRAIEIHSEQEGTNRVLLVERVSTAGEGSPTQVPMMIDDVGVDHSKTEQPKPEKNWPWSGCLRQPGVESMARH